jgi:hypothetical protein
MSSHPQTVHSFSGALLARLRSLLGVTCEPVDLPEDVVFEVLSNERRRRAVAHIAALDEDETVALGDLAKEIAAEENGKRVDEVTTAERKAAYVSLYQTHLDSLDAAEVLDADDKEISRGHTARDVASVLSKVDGTLPRGE